MKLEADQLMAFVEETSKEHGRQGLDEVAWPGAVAGAVDDRFLALSKMMVFEYV